MNTAKDENDLNKIYNLSEDYQSTVHALLAFAAFVVHDGRGIRDGSHFGFGRRMDTSEANPVRPSATVTPDLVAQKDVSFGVVAEVKRSLSPETETWTRHLEQMRKYDDRLKGWWTDNEEVSRSDAVLLVHQSRARAFVRFLRERLNDDPDCVGPSTSVVEFNRSDEANVYIFFRTEWGRTTDPELRSRLEDGVPVPLQKVLLTFPAIKFYDVPPPTAWLMTLLWTDMFSSLQDPAQYDERKKATLISVTVERLTLELQSAYGSGALEWDERSTEFPKQAWIRRALNVFVSAKLAVADDKPGAYTILYRTLRGDVLKRFFRLTEKFGEEPDSPDGQLELGLGEDG